MSWWDGNMIGNSSTAKRNRTLLGWGLAGGKHTKRMELFGRPSHYAKQEPVPRSKVRAQAAHRSRLLAEHFEGVSSSSDQHTYGTGPFGRLALGSIVEYWRRERREGR